MNSVLVVSASEKAALRIGQWLGEDSYTPVHAPTVADAEALLRARRFDLLVVNAPLADGDGEALCLRSDVCALLLLPEARYAADSVRLSQRGVLTLSKPLNVPLFAQAVALLAATRARLGHLQEKLEEVRLIDRAKWALIEVLKMSEAQAHRYIEKQAMDLRQTRRRVAENIVKTYEY
ncbi:MAG: ANTAR domain-containing protein [Oscillospiraceae bacterium]|nr:ANTAR domain-containing protein [Oscillospiraceae bacterium]